ncbi:MAG: cupin domain-containing protein [Candidatus Helarchaeota archaeon]|nr:cupin domain-containing protein [Candidatus Helarchaeota archaeon]
MSEIKKEKPTKEDIEKMLKEWSPWECDISTFDWEYFDTETCYIIEGEVKVKTATGETEIRAGDLVKFPKGLKCVWDVKKPIRKVYTFGD